jgi:gluconate 2-dehydrogenase gamma chain
MNRKPRPAAKSSCSFNVLSDWHQQLITRRRFLKAAAGGSLAAIFPLSSGAAAGNRQSTDVNPETNLDPWPVIDAVQQHLFPAETDAPGAREINALGYLQFVITDDTLDTDSREFIKKGVAWLQDMTYQMHKTSFVNLDEKDREKVLRKIAGSEAGENWLSTLLLYIVEALLTDPVYGGNTQQLGWKWLQHVPGFPRPPVDKTFLRLLS